MTRSKKFFKTPAGLAFDVRDLTGGLLTGGLVTPARAADAAPSPHPPVSFTSVPLG